MGTIPDRLPAGEAARRESLEGVAESVRIKAAGEGKTKNAEHDRPERKWA